MLRPFPSVHLGPHSCPLKGEGPGGVLAGTTSIDTKHPAILHLVGLPLAHQKHKVAPTSYPVHFSCMLFSTLCPVEASNEGCLAQIFFLLTHEMMGTRFSVLLDTDMPGSLLNTALVKAIRENCF